MILRKLTFPSQNQYKTAELLRMYEIRLKMYYPEVWREQQKQRFGKVLEREKTKSSRHTASAPSSSTSISASSPPPAPKPRKRKANVEQDSVVTTDDAGIRWGAIMH